MYKSGICDKTSDISETKQSRAKVTTECLCKLVYGLSVGDKSGDLGCTLAYFFWEHFFARDISHTFCRSATKFGRVMDLANRNLFPEFHQLSSGCTVIPRGDMHQSFTNALAKWFFNDFPVFADRFRLVSIHCVVRGLDCPRIRCKLSVHVSRIAL